MLRNLAIVTASALAVSACAGMNGDAGSSGTMASGTSGAGSSAMGGSSMGSGSAMAMPAMDYMTAAGQSDAYEMQSSQLALAQSQNPRVRDFATRMIRDHGKTTATLMAAAQKSGMAPPSAPPPLRPDQQLMVAQLQGMTGAGFDSAYVQQQVTAHQQALDLHSSYAKNGTDANLKTAARAAVPIVSAHLQMVQGMASSMSR